MSDTARRKRDIGARIGTGLAVGLVLLAVALVLRSTRHQALLGFDSYPILVSSQVASFGDLVDTFRERLMDGRYPGAFYRPLLNLSFAIDHALWGLDPSGYQLGSALAFGACAFAVFALARALSGGVTLGAWVALAAFLLHPSHAEVLPVPSRRAESLCGGLLALAFAWQLSAFGTRAARAFGAGALSLLAIAAKETALLAPVPGFAAGWLAAPAGAGAAARLRSGARAATPHVLAAAAMLGARLGVLGGLGGHAESGPEGALAGLPGVAGRIVALLVAPQPELQRHAAAFVLLAVGAGAALLAARAAGGPRSAVRLAGFGAAWLAASLVAYAGAGVLRPWYLLIPAVGFALLLGAAAEVARAALARGAPAARAAALAVVLSLGSLLGWQARYSPLFAPSTAWDEATRASDAFLSALAARIDAAPDGGAIQAPPLPRWVPPERARPAVRGAAILNADSVQAWAELRFPERRIRVARGDPAGVAPPAPDELVVVLARLREGFFRPERKERAP